MAPDAAARMAAILNAAYLVRHYARGRYCSFQQAQRAAAIRALGLACRDAFNTSDDFEPLLAALVDSLAPQEARF